MNERAVYNSEDGKWYSEHETPWVIRNLGVGEKVHPFHSTVADTYADAFVGLFGHALVIPPITRSVRRVELA